MSHREVALVHPDTLRAWHEEVSPGQYAVHPSQRSAAAPACIVCDSLPEAETYARELVEQQPSLRCRIYDHHGFVGAPLAEFTGPQFKGERDLSPRVRRWLGVIMLAVGLALCALDWSTNFRLTWPGLVGSRLLIPGLILLVTEGLLMLHAHQKALQSRKEQADS